MRNHQRISIIAAITTLVAGLFFILQQEKTVSASQAAVLDAVDPAFEARTDFVQNLIERFPPAEAAANAASSVINTESLANFPHQILYGGAYSSGWPFVGTLDDTLPAADAPLNTAVLDAYAKFPHVIIPVMPLGDLRPDIITGLKQRNPSIQLFGYVVGHTSWCPVGAGGNIAYPANTYYRDYWIAASGGPSCTTSSDRMLWLQNGALATDPPYNAGMNVNLAHRVQNPDSSYRYDVAEALAETMYDYSDQGHGFDGIFIDVYCRSILWSEHGDTDPSPSVDNSTYYDYARAGYGSDNSNPANRTAFDQGWAAGHLRLSERLRELATADGQPDYPIAGNCGPGSAEQHSILNGWMRENYPLQNGGSFYSNLLTLPWGYLHQDHEFRSPQYNYIFTAAEPTGYVGGLPVHNGYTALNQRKMRFGLGSATLGNGWHAFHDSSGDPSRGFWFDWWYDEYGVDVSVPQSHPDFGQAKNGLAYTGWLGQPLGSATQMLSTTYASLADMLTTNQSFETAGGTSTTAAGWNLINFQGAGASIIRDTTEATVGSASIKAVVNTPDPVYSYVVRAESGSFQANAYQEYGVTFWAKASDNLPLSITFGGVSGAIQTIRVDQEWRQYQAVIRPLTSSATASVRIEFGQMAGTYWLDDVHVQSTPSNVWRRDFDRGIVLVNPTINDQTVVLEKPYKKILGTVSPILNDGSFVTQVTLPGTSGGSGLGDAVFLLTVDSVVPSTVTDLRPQ